MRVVRDSDDASRGPVVAPRGVGAELQALREEMHASQVRAYDAHLQVLSELWPRCAAEFEAIWEDQDQIISDTLTQLRSERVRAYDRELVLWSELARMREAWKAAVERRPVQQQGEEVVTVMVHTREDGSRVHRIVEPSPERVHALAALPEDQVATLHGLGPKGAIR